MKINFMLYNEDKIKGRIFEIVPSNSENFILNTQRDTLVCVGCKNPGRIDPKVNCNPYEKSPEFCMDFLYEHTCKNNGFCLFLPFA